MLVDGVVREEAVDVVFGVTAVVAVPWFFSWFSRTNRHRSLSVIGDRLQFLLFLFVFARCFAAAGLLKKI